MKKINVFCLPYAGGNKYSYRKLIEQTPPFLNLIPLEYPGRGGRMQTPLITDLALLVNDLYRQVKDIVDEETYSIYGHSMGGLAASLLARKLLQHNHRPPVHLFITGTSGPSSPSRDEKKRHLMDKKDFIQEIRDFQGSPEEILQNQELLNYFEPILRADFTATETYVYKEEEPLPIPITVITGMEEDLEEDDVRLWQKESVYKVDFRRLPGNHFFIFKYPHEILNIISRKLMSNNKTYQS